MLLASSSFLLKAIRPSRVWIALTVLVLFASGSKSLATTDIVDSNGFESGFIPGALEGQSGWLRSSFSLGAGSVPGNGTVQSSVVESGSQAVQVDRGLRTDDRWAMPVGGQGFPNHRYILIDWDMNVTATGATEGFGPFFGVDSYRAPAGLTVIGSLGVDATTGDVLYQRVGGNLDITGTSVGFGVWNHFQMRLDFEDDVYTMFVNGTEVLASGFVDGPASTFTDADIAAFAAGGDAVSQNATGTAYFDNFLVRDVSPADFDIDGDVDELDLATFQAAYGSSDAGDTDGDGDTDGADFLTLQRDYDGAAPLSALASVPEPSSLALAVLAMTCLTRRMR